MNAMENSSEIGSGAAAGVEDTDGGAGQSEGLIELGTEKMVNALDHILHDLFWGVPNTEILAKDRIKGFKEWLVKVGYGFIFAECIEKGGLNAVKGFAGEIENLL
jgi:hypothetical protein